MSSHRLSKNPTVRRLQDVFSSIAGKANKNVNYREIKWKLRNASHGQSSMKIRTFTNFFVDLDSHVCDAPSMLMPKVAIRVGLSGGLFLSFDARNWVFAGASQQVSVIDAEPKKNCEPSKQHNLTTYHQNFS